MAKASRAHPRSTTAGEEQDRPRLLVGINGELVCRRAVGGAPSPAVAGGAPGPRRTSACTSLTLAPAKTFEQEIGSRDAPDMAQAEASPQLALRLTAPDPLIVLSLTIRAGLRLWYVFWAALTKPRGKR